MDFLEHSSPSPISAPADLRAGQSALPAHLRGSLVDRGAVASDGKSSDGVAVTTNIPRDWLLARTGIHLLDRKPLGVGVVFLPSDDGVQKIELEAALAGQEIETLHWRPVPIRPEVLGEIADSMRPAIWHLLCTSDDPAGFDRRLFLARKQFER